jgi:hypothetical protein
MVEYVNFEKLLNERFFPDQSYIKKFLLKGVYNVGFMSYIARVGLDKWRDLPKYEKYESVGFDDLLAYLMTAYNKVVGEDVIGPVIAEMKKVLDEFAKNTAPMVNVERLKETLELREREDETDE